jgi:predicted acyltransferase
VLYAAGWASVVLAGLIWIIDIKSYKKWTSFFVAFGMNPLFIFALSGLWANTLSRIIKFTNNEGQLTSGNSWLYHQVFVPLAGPLNGSLLFALAHVAFFWIIARILYQKKIFIKV